MYAQDKDCIYNFAMTFTLSLTIWLKVTEHHFPKGTVWSMRQIRPRVEKICSGQAKSDGQMDGQTDHYKAPPERGPNYVLIEK